MAVSLGSEYYTLKKKLKDVPESETGQSSVSKSTEAQDEKKEIHKRHQKVLEARAKLHVEAGVGFLARFKHSAEVVGAEKYLVQPQVLASRGPGWCFPGGSRLLLSLDLKEGSANIVPAERVPSYVSLIKDSWQPYTGPDVPLVQEATGTALYWTETGLAEVVDSHQRYTAGTTRARNHETTDITYSISAAHAMYRMMCLFPSLELDTQYADFYKCIWEVRVQHKPSGFILRFSEHKGSLFAAAHWSQGSPWEACFKSEVCALVDLLLSDACLHPCGVVAGSIDPRHLEHFKNPDEKFKQYPVDPQEIFTNRLEDEDYKRVEVVRKPWTPIAEPDRIFRERTATWCPCAQPSRPDCSIMLYYRLLAIYSHLSEAPEPDLPVFMKSTNPAESLWYTELKDKDAGLIVRIGDCRGAAAVWVAALDLAAGTVLATAKEHLEDLLALICSPRCPHTYDGTVAGCVA